MTDDNDEKPRRAKAKGDARLKTPRLHMTPAQFRKWVADMGYPPAKLTNVSRKIPYDTRVIAEDLGVQAKQIYGYWWAYESMDEKIAMHGSIVRLCRALLKIKQQGQALVAAKKTIQQLEEKLAVSQAEVSRLKDAARMMLKSDD